MFSALSTTPDPPPPSGPLLPHTHDSFIKWLLQSPARAAPLLRSFTPPDIVDNFAWDGLELLSGEHISQELRALHSDLLFRVPLKSDKGGIVIHLAVEHQSTVERNMVSRCFAYAGSMHRRLLREDPTGFPPAIRSVVIYNGPQRWTAPLTLTEAYGLPETLQHSLGSRLPQLQYDLMDLSQISNQALLESDQPAINKVALWALKNARHSPHLLQQIGTWKIEFQKVYAKLGQDGILPILFYLLTANPHLTLDQIMEQAHAIFEPSQAQAMQGEMQGTWYRHAHKCRQEGRQAGIQEGRQAGIQEGRQAGIQKGRQAGQRELLQRLLLAKFGSLSAKTANALEAATSEQLTDWCERLLTAESVDDVIRL